MGFHYLDFFLVSCNEISLFAAGKFTMNIMQKCANAICPIKQQKRQWLQRWAVHTLAGVIGKICCIHLK
jgi:hypothetical protein